MGCDEDDARLLFTVTNVKGKRTLPWSVLIGLVDESGDTLDDFVYFDDQCSEEEELDGGDSPKRASLVKTVSKTESTRSIRNRASARLSARKSCEDGSGGDGTSSMASMQRSSLQSIRKMPSNVKRNSKDGQVPENLKRSSVNNRSAGPARRQSLHQLHNMQQRDSALGTQIASFNTSLRASLADPVGPKALVAVTAPVADTSGRSSQNTRQSKNLVREVEKLAKQIASVENRVDQLSYEREDQKEEAQDTVQRLFDLIEMVSDKVAPALRRESFSETIKPPPDLPSTIIPPPLEPHSPGANAPTEVPPSLNAPQDEEQMVGGHRESNPFDPRAGEDILHLLEAASGGGSDEYDEGNDQDGSTYPDAN